MSMLKRFLILLAVCVVVGGVVAAQDMTYNEAPSLAENVAAGELPPVAERLPANPIVEEPVEQIGQYGGTWHMLDENNNLGFTLMTTGVEPFLKWNRDASGFRPNILDPTSGTTTPREVDDHFREGIKWSDGEPLTVDDYLFWWNDMVLDGDRAGRSCLRHRRGRRADERRRSRRLHAHITFAAPNPLFLEVHSRGPWNSAQSLVPAHYMKQFHPKYNSRRDRHDRADEPLQHGYPSTTTRICRCAGMSVLRRRPRYATFTRNPYYWKVDSEGNQLPYIDNIQVEIASGAVSEQVALKAIAGELDMQVRDIALQDVPLILESAEAGGYHVIMWDRGDFAWPWLMLFYDLADKGIEDLMYTQAFREALSAINRDRINDVTALGLATPRQFSMLPQAEEFQSPEGQALYQEWSARPARCRRGSGWCPGSGS